MSPAHAGPLDAVGLSEVLGVGIEPELLRLALTHRSFAYENGGLPHNERLEFLGDSVLSIVVTDALFRQFPDLPEGRLAKMRASVVNMRALADVARGMGSGGLGAYLRLGRGEEATGGRDKHSILADALEAVLGAVYLDQGTATAHRVVHALFDPLLAAAAHQGAALDWKTSLQELTAALGLGVPDYAIESEGPDHERRFTARAVVRDEQFDACVGRNKKEAEQAAAAMAWNVLRTRADTAGAIAVQQQEAVRGHEPPRRPRASATPELPEVETVRAGLQRAVVGRRIADIAVRHPRAVRRHAAGSVDFAARLRGARVEGTHRRGKYLWLSMAGGHESATDGPVTDGPATGGQWCLLAHLGMSGQLLVQAPDRAVPVHLRVAVRFDDGGPELRFVDQRTFGGLVLDELVAVPDAVGAMAPPETVPSLIAHIARDPLDPRFDAVAWRRRARRSRSTVKRLLLDQSLLSGVGNIYADEALWRARLHGSRAAASLRPPAWSALLGHVRGVMSEALAQGGTSFDALYVDVDGRSGYFERALAVYGQEGRPCPRCATPIRRSPFMNRSSFWCPRCQRPPRAAPA